MHSNEVYISSKGQKEQLQKSNSLQFEFFPEAENKVLNIYPDLKYQKIDGFGGAFTESSAVNYRKMCDKTKSELLEMLFGKSGLRYNFCRATINSCDFSVSEYTYVEKGDTALKTFDISHDEKEIIPFIKAAAKVAENDIFMFASPWSPCGWMKDTGIMIEGGTLKKEMYTVWAEYFVKFINEYKKCGINISAVTVQNEPMATQIWESCKFTAKEQVLFVRDFLYPAFVKAGLENVEIYIWDHNKQHLYDWARELVSIKDADKCISGIAFHWYTGEHFDSLKFAHDVAPRTKLILSEFCFGGLTQNWQHAEKYAYEICEDFNNYNNACCDWNLVLDEKGGPYHNRKGPCQAVIEYNAKKDILTKNPQYYAVQHFSKFIEKGAIRLGTTKFNDKINISAFQNPNGQIVSVIINRSEHSNNCMLRINDYAAPIELKENSITTVVIKANEL